MRKLSLIAFLICFSTMILKAQELINKIEVIGKAEIEVLPDDLEYSITLQEYYKSDTSKSDIEKLEKTLIKAVAMIGLASERLTINSTQGSRINNTENKSYKFLESRSYIIRINSINDINNLLPQLDKLGISNAYLNKKVKKNKDKFENDLRIDAIKDARNKANSIAESVGKKIGNIILIQENNSSGIALNYSDFNDLNPISTSYKGSFETNINVEKTTLYYNVKVTFQMK